MSGPGLPGHDAILDLSMQDYAARRHLMVEAQLRPNAIENEPLLAAMGEIPREAFVPGPLKGVAYGDEDIRLNDGRCLIEPLVLGKLLQAASVKPTDVALVVGCTTGYSAAVLSKMTTTVFCMESDTERLAKAEKVFAELACDNIVTVDADPADGYPAQAPYDVVLICGSVQADSRAAEIAIG